MQANTTKKETDNLNYQSLVGERRGSNPRHSEPQSDALPTELQSPFVDIKFQRHKGNTFFLFCNRNIDIFYKKLGRVDYRR